MNQVKEIIDLNKCCLLKIFTYLNYEDLLCLKKVDCGFFDDALDSVISTSCFEFTTQSTTDNNGSYEKKMEKNSEFLENFGHKLNYLNIDVDSETPEQKKAICQHYKTLIANYCSNGNIKHCILRNLDLSTEFVKDNWNFFNSLETLFVIGSGPDGLKSSEFMLLMDTISKSEIKRLEIFDNEILINFNVFQSIAASQLKTCVINVGLCHGDPPKSFDYETSEMPINITMKNLDLGIYSFDLMYLSHFPNIKVLELTVFTRYSLEPIANLDNLRKLSLLFDICDVQEVLSVLQKLAKKNLLEYLELKHKPTGSIEYPETYTDTDCDKDESSLANTLYKMTNLKKLRLNTVYLFGRQLQLLGRNLKNLRKFDYDAICNIEVDQILAKFEEFITVARNLTLLIIGVKMEVPNPEQSQRFYENIVRIRQSQGADVVLRLWFPGKTDVLGTADQAEYVDL